MGRRLRHLVDRALGCTPEQIEARLKLSPTNEKPRPKTEWNGKIKHDNNNEEGN